MRLKERLVKRFRQIASKHGVTYTEVNTIFKSQFKFTKEKIEEISKEDLSNMEEKDLEKFVFNFLFLGKMFTDKKLQEFGKKYNLKKEKNGGHTDGESIGAE